MPSTPFHSAPIHPLRPTPLALLSLPLPSPPLASVHSPLLPSSLPSPPLILSPSLSPSPRTTLTLPRPSSYPRTASPLAYILLPPLLVNASHHTSPSDLHSGRRSAMARRLPTPPPASEISLIGPSLYAPRIRIHPDGVHEEGQRGWRGPGGGGRGEI